MEPLPAFLAVGILILAAWNVVERRRYAPKALSNSFEKLSAGCEGTLKRFGTTLQTVVDSEENRRLESIKLKREFLDLIDQEEEVLGRIDTKNRRIQSAEARAEARQTRANGSQMESGQPGSLLDEIRADMRARGM